MNDPKPSARAGFLVVGRDVPRTDAVPKVTGAAQYVADLHFPGMLHAAVLRSPHPSARIVRLDTSAAAAMPGVKVHAPAGTFYIFPNVAGLLGKSAGNHRIENVDDLCDWLIAERHVATVPGSAFGDDQCIRLSVAASDEDIRKGLDRMASAFSTLAGAG